MDKRLLVAMVLFLFAGAASAQVVVDSVSIEPSYVEPGNNVDIAVKFHDSLVAREVYSNPAGGAGRSPAASGTNPYYLVRIVPNDDLSSRYVVVKEGEKKVGALFKGETWSTPFKIQFSNDAPAASYSFEFQVYQTDENYGTLTLSRTYDFNLTVNGIVQFTIVADDQAKAGEQTKFKVQMTNVGKGIARHVSASMNVSSPLSVLGSNEVYLGDVADSTPRDIQFELYVDSTAAPKAYDVPLSISYIDRSGAVQRVSKNIGIKVLGSPKIEVSLDKADDLKAGISGKATISVANKAFIDAKFLSLQLLDTNDYTVTSSSNVYIGNLASDDFQTEDFTIKVANGASGRIPMKVKVSYTEENNNVAHDDEFTVYLNVLSSEDYLKLHPQTNGTQTLITALIVIPALIVVYLVLWLLLKIVGLITNFIDKRVFKR